MFGKILIISASALSVISTLLFFASYWKNKALPKKIAGWSYSASALLLGTASVFLMVNILAHNYSYAYIWEYSSNELPLYLLLTTFFAGQEGSFLLWALVVAVTGLFLRSYAKKFDYEELTMGLFSFIMLFLCLMLIAKGPFESIWDKFPEAQPGIAPTNGHGLNPILQNYWNMIHPPILFIGYGAMCVPYVFALAGLIKKEYKKWIEVAMPFTLIASSILGFGIMLGGFWAYETLGWGGFWGWDPVENSSLLPWLVSVALVHTFLVQKKTGGLIKTNFVLAVLSFLLVIYATFLTRSGILGEISVHSFGMPGTIVYALLLLFLVIFALIGIVALLLNLKAISSISEKTDFTPSSREFYLTLGSILLLASTLIIFIGTSLPIFQNIFGLSPATVAASFYINWNLPIVILILLANAVSFFLAWKRTPLKSISNKIIIYSIIALICTATLYALGMRRIEYALLCFSSIFSLAVNFDFLLSRIRNNGARSGAYISHIGVSLLMLGVLAGGAYSTTRTLRLRQGKPVRAMGYNITYTGKEQIEKEYSDRLKYKYNIDIQSGSSKMTVSPVIYRSDYNRRRQAFLEPGIKTRPTGDIYVSPLSIETSLDVPTLSLMKTQAEQLPLDSTITITMEHFDMAHSSEEVSGMDDKIPFGVIVSLQRGNETSSDTLYSFLDKQTFTGEPIWMPVLDANIEMAFVQWLNDSKSLATSRAVFMFREKGKDLPAPVEYFTCEITSKPFMNLVWAGTILIAIGFLIAVPRHARKNSKTVKEDYELNGNNTGKQIKSAENIESNT